MTDDSTDLQNASPTDALSGEIVPFAPKSVAVPSPDSDRITIVTSTAAAAQDRTGEPEFVRFERVELDMLLGMYGQRVARGEWRDYAIDMLRDRAVFSVFRRTAEMPLYRIEKNPKLARRQGAFSVVSSAGVVLKRGHELRLVLRVLDRKSKVVSL